jgi:hypothetical protein
MTCGGFLPPKEKEVANYITWPRGVPVEIAFTEGSPEEVTLSVHKWSVPKEAADGVAGYDRLAELMKRQARNLPEEASVSFQPGSQMWWLPDVVPGKYLVLISASYYSYNALVTVGIAYPVEFE